MRFTIGDWAVEPSSNSLSRGDERRALEPRAMAVLQALCRRPGEVLSAEQLLAECWPEQPLGDNPVHKTVAQLRRALDDSATAPRYLETIRKRGYRIVAPVLSADGPAAQAREGGWRGGSPFRGLQAFDAEHAEVFFGREAALREALDALHALWRRRRAFLLLLGPSGSGKTSLVMAGLFPALQRGTGAPQGLSATQLDLGDVGQHAPLAALAAALLDWEVADRPLFPGASAESLARNLAERPRSVLAEIDAALAGRGPDAALLLFIDRLEALFVAPQLGGAAGRGLMAVLELLADSGRVAVVAACRNDFYPRLAEHPLLMRDKQLGAHLDLAPPTPAEVAQMIRLPARAAGLSFGIDAATRTRLDDQLCDDAARSPDALPLLQYTLEELYRQRNAHGELGFATYRELGGLEGAIGLRAEALLDALDPAQREAAPRVLALLINLPGEGARVTGRRAAWSELGSAAELGLVQALVDARLLVSDLVDGEAGFRVAHEAILRRWPRVSDWIASHQQALRLRSRLQQQSARWLAEGRAAEYLLPQGRQLIEASELLDHAQIGLGAGEQDFVRASQRQAARGRRLRLAAVASLALLAVLSAGLAWRADRAETLARQRSDQADDLLGYMLGDFAEKLRPIGRLELLHGVGAKALAHLGTAPDGAQDRSVLQRAKALTVLGEVSVSKRELDAAVEPLRNARALLAHEPVDPSLQAEWRRAQGTADFWVGHVHYTRREFGPARQAWEDYRRHAADWLALAPQDADARLELSFAQNSLGTLMLDSGDLPGAARQFQASIELKQRLLAARPQDLSLRAWWSNSVSWLGTTLLWQGDFEAARAQFARGLDGIAEARTQAPGDLEWQGSEAAMRSWLGQAMHRLGRDTQAHAEFQTAATLYRHLLRQQPDNRKWSTSLARAEVQLLETQAPGRGAARLNELLAEMRAQDRGVGAASALRRLPHRVQALLALLRELHVQGRDREALAPLQELHQELAHALEQQPDDLRLVVEQARLTLALAGVQREQGEPRAARRSCEAVLDGLGKQRALLRVHYEITEAWVGAHSCLDLGGQARSEQQWLEARRNPPV